ncbi:AlbA family DNA-binding domain-containing protein [Faecalibacterium intestinale]|uniref:ATP-binding protein n=1 Tax=Faecalibacterium intestinale TaxID=3133155 RepID=A0ABV1C3X9_9FIRM
MVNINSKPWEELQFKDVQDYLSDPDSNENCFFEYKIDKVEPAKLVKEISAFANTYGGYIFLGVDDNKNIVGCTAWNEQRIHITIHNGITPTPQFDVKCFSADDKIIYVIKIEEGAMPPYITNKGDICERVSSGSCVVTESGKLNQMYHKRADQLLHIKSQIELPEVEAAKLPNNVFGYWDFGFSVVTSEQTNLQKNFYTIDLEPIAKYLREINPEFSITRVGYSYVFGMGSATVRTQNGKVVPTAAGVHDFMEIMLDGSVRGRLLLIATPETADVDITSLFYYSSSFLRKVYSLIFGDGYSDIFVYAQKYEKLTVLKQFVPFYKLGTEDSESDKNRYREYLENHKRKYGNNLIMTSNRIPKSDYEIIDRKYFDELNMAYNTGNLYRELFYSAFMNLGYIDRFESSGE